MRTNKNLVVPEVRNALARELLLINAVVRHYRSRKDPDRCFGDVSAAKSMATRLQKYFKCPKTLRKNGYVLHCTEYASHLRPCRFRTEPLTISLEDFEDAAENLYSDLDTGERYTWSVEQIQEAIFLFVKNEIEKRLGENIDKTFMDAKTDFWLSKTGEPEYDKNEDDRY